MPKFMKDKAIGLLDSGLETYLLALYGLTLPSVRVRERQDSKYAPVMGLFGTSTELIIKACHSVWNTKAKKYGKYYCRKDYHKIKQYFIRPDAGI